MWIDRTFFQSADALVGQSDRVAYGCVFGRPNPHSVGRQRRSDPGRQARAPRWTQALPACDIATPNRFETERLTGLSCSTLSGAKQAVLRLRAMLRADGPACVLLTSLETEDTPADQIDMMAFEGGAFHLLRTPRLGVTVNGAGDAIAALFLFHRLRTGSAMAALEAAGSSIYGLLRRTEEAGSREILTVAAQDEFVSPTRVFSAWTV